MPLLSLCQHLMARSPGAAHCIQLLCLLDPGAGNNGNWNMSLPTNHVHGGVPCLMAQRVSADPLEAPPLTQNNRTMERAVAWPWILLETRNPARKPGGWILGAIMTRRTGWWSEMDAATTSSNVLRSPGVPHGEQWRMARMMKEGQTWNWVHNSNVPCHSQRTVGDEQHKLADQGAMAEIHESKVVALCLMLAIVGSIKACGIGWICPRDADTNACNSCNLARC